MVEPPLVYVGVHVHSMLVYSAWTILDEATGMQEHADYSMEMSSQGYCVCIYRANNNNTVVICSAATYILQTIE